MNLVITRFWGIDYEEGIQPIEARKVKAFVGLITNYQISLNTLVSP